MIGSCIHPATLPIIVVAFAIQVHFVIITLKCYNYIRGKLTSAAHRANCLASHLSISRKIWSFKLTSPTWRLSLVIALNQFTLSSRMSVFLYKHHSNIHSRSLSLVFLFFSLLSSPSTSSCFTFSPSSSTTRPLMSTTCVQTFLLPQSHTGCTLRSCLHIKYLFSANQ